MTSKVFMAMMGAAKSSTGFVCNVTFEDAMSELILRAYIAKYRL